MPLIAVPAKITDDFHMIALKRFCRSGQQQHRASAQPQLVDIPITYRNGAALSSPWRKGRAERTPSTRPCRLGEVPAAQLPAGNSLRPVEIRATRRRLFDRLIPVTSTEMGVERVRSLGALP